jgi:diadenosine tetraphosphatase ApaH/serine/threonine PP2A family protein phosphatase
MYLSRASYTTIDSFEELSSLIDQSNEHTAWLFNIDDITYPADELCQHTTSDQLRRAAHKKYPDLIKPSYAADIMSTMLKQAERPVVDAILPQQIKQLKQKKSRVTGIAQLYTGSYGSIDNIDAWRYEKLCHAGIDFYDPSFPEELVFSSFEPLKHNHARYHKGLLLSHDDTLDIIIGHYLDAFIPRPHHVVYCDYSPQQLARVEHAVTKRGMKFTGIHYKGARKHHKKETSLDRALFQLGHLIDTGVWLNDQQATHVMHQKEQSYQIINTKEIVLKKEL